MCFTARIVSPTMIHQRPLSITRPDPGDPEGPLSASSRAPSASGQPRPEASKLDSTRVETRGDGVEKGAKLVGTRWESRGRSVWTEINGRGKARASPLLSGIRYPARRTPRVDPGTKKKRLIYIERRPMHSAPFHRVSQAFSPRRPERKATLPGPPLIDLTR